MQNKNEEKSVKAWASVSLLLKYLHQRPSKSKAALVSVWKGEACCCWHMHILWWMDGINDEVRGVASYVHFGEKKLPVLSATAILVKKAFNTSPPTPQSLYCLLVGWLSSAQLNSLELRHPHSCLLASASFLLQWLQRKFPISWRRSWTRMLETKDL